MVPEPLTDAERLANHAGHDRERRRHSWANAVLRVILAGSACALIALGIGFARFVGTLEDDAFANSKADAIVALTGGSERISDAVELLAEGHAQRLLITGVNRTTSPERLANTLPQHRELFDCCIDMDYQARNTVGNAVETRRWANSRNIRSLIVVTSSYHMPRAMIELQRAMPDVALRPHPVSPDKPPEQSFWRALSSRAGNTRILATEYGKFLAAYVRASLFPEIVVDMSATGSLKRKTSHLVRSNQDRL